MTFRLVIGFAAAAVSSASGQTLPRSLELSPLRRLPVQHDGRWPPLDTVARDLVEEVTGGPAFQGHDPVAVLLAWTFDAPGWMEVPLIPLGNAELRRELQLSPTQTVFSYAELAGHGPLRGFFEALAAIEQDRKLDPLESKVSDIESKLMVLQRIFRGEAIRPIPDSADPLGVWRAIDLTAQGHTDGTEDAAVVGAWAELRTAFLADDAAGFAAAAENLAASLAGLPAAYRPDPATISTELRYNRLRPFRTAWGIMVGGAVLAGLAMVVRRPWMDAVAIVGLIIGFAALTYGLSLRWTIAGRIPASNMFESLLFLSWGMGAFATVAMLVTRHRIVPLTASAMGALSLVLADCLPLDHYVRPIAPVLLDTVWMSIHVPVIMVSYSVLALGVLFAHVQLVGQALRPSARRFAEQLDALHYWYVHVGSILLLTGIVTGSMWAAFSWGRTWGWDPKEVWSLVALLGYLTILHVRIDHDRIPRGGILVALILGGAMLLIVAPRFGSLTGRAVLGFAGTGAALLLMLFARGTFATALKSILCFWLVIMTYVGVNYVLGIGLHSYGFGTGAMARYMFLIGGVDLALAAVCTVVYLMRRSAAPTVGRLSTAASPA